MCCVAAEKGQSRKLVPGLHANFGISKLHISTINQLWITTIVVILTLKMVVYGVIPRILIRNGNTVLKFKVFYNHLYNNVTLYLFQACDGKCQNLNNGDVLKAVIGLDCQSTIRKQREGQFNHILALLNLYLKKPNPLFTHERRVKLRNFWRTSWGLVMIMTTGSSIPNHFSELTLFKVLVIVPIILKKN